MSIATVGPVRLHAAEVLEWAASYDGEPCHALLCDPPYHLTTDARFGGDGAPAATPMGERLSRGFMGKAWDGGDIAHRPETWATLTSILQPGAFVIAFAGSRGYHRQLCAMEDAGLVVHPSIFNASSGASVEVPSLLGWATGSGFPKATQVGAEGFDGHRYGRQALKPALEPILVAQVPYRGAARTCIAATGAGAWHIDAGRLGITGGGTHCDNRDESGRYRGHRNAGRSTSGETFHGPDYSAGRWPANLCLTHHPACECVGERRVAASANWREGDGSELSGAGAVAPVGPGGKAGRCYADADGLETVADWQCHPDCAVGHLADETRQWHQTRAGWVSSDATRFYHQADWSYEVAEALAAADPVRYVAKASRAEREAGLESLPLQTAADLTGRQPGSTGLVGNAELGYDHNPLAKVTTDRRNVHPTVKPIALARWLAALLLPPDRYAPRRIFVPFAGVCSEAIACGLAGWEEVIAVEREAEYAAIGEARCRWHLAQPSLFGGAE